MASIPVYLLRVDGAVTLLWASEQVLRSIKEESGAREKVHEKLATFSKAGLRSLVGSENSAVRREPSDGKPVYRVWHKSGSNYRMFGQFSGQNDFILLDAFMRGRGQYTASEMKRINRVGFLIWHKVTKTNV